MKSNLLKNISSNNQQAGVTLLLAILVLSSILAISFSVATIMFSEIRTSGDLLRTEDAFYGAEAVSEEALFKIKRGITSGFIYSTQIGAVSLGSPAPTENVINPDSTQRVIVPARSGFTSSANHYLFFNANASSQSAGSGYGKLTITNLSPNSNDAVTIYLCQYDPAGVDEIPCESPSSNPYWLVRAYNLTSAQTPLTVDKNYGVGFDPAKQQELILYNTSDNNIYVQIQTFAAESPTGSGTYPALGLPYFGQKSVDINATNSGVGRKIRVIIPTPN